MASGACDTNLLFFLSRVLRYSQYARPLAEREEREGIRNKVSVGKSYQSKFALTKILCILAHLL